MRWKSQRNGSAVSVEGPAGVKKIYLRQMSAGGAKSGATEQRPKRGRSVLDEGVDVELGEDLAALQKFELDQERESHDVAAGLLDEVGGRAHRAAGGQQVVHD